MKTLIKKCKKESGQGLVEFALISPLLLLLVLGMMEYGWLLNAKIAFNSAAKEAARTMIVADSDASSKWGKADTIAKQILGTRYESLTPGVTILNNAESGSNLKVTVKGKVTPLVGFFEKEPVKMESTATMRME